MSNVSIVTWSEEECEQYRATILARKQDKPEMELTEADVAFIERRHTEPRLMYRTRRDRAHHFDMSDFKENAYQQISVICQLEEPLAISVIHHDFGVEREHNKDLPLTTYALFSYIDDNAEALVQEMLELGILEQVVAPY